MNWWHSQQFWLCHVYLQETQVCLKKIKKEEKAEKVFCTQTAYSWTWFSFWKLQGPCNGILWQTPGLSHDRFQVSFSWQNLPCKGVVYPAKGIGVPVQGCENVGKAPTVLPKFESNPGFRRNIEQWKRASQAHGPHRCRSGWGPVVWKQVGSMRETRSGERKPGEISSHTEWTCRV